MVPAYGSVSVKLSLWATVLDSYLAVGREVREGVDHSQASMVVEAMSAPIASSDQARRDSSSLSYLGLFLNVP